ncbi:TPR repeat [Rivularia sp. IAM M-261]|nr:TPR repeat [Calothrix sp. PCC 7716]GJD18585.1 TPR repeat [Rivularia sp. IAM M-261]
MQCENFNRGLEKAKLHDYTGAIVDFTAELEVNPYFAEAYLQRGLAYYDLGEALRAVSDYTEALKLDSKLIQAYYSRALARMVLKNLPSAIDDIERAIRLDYNYAAAHNLRGTLLRKSGDVHGAIVSFKKAAELYIVQKDAENCRLCMEKIKQLQPKPQPQQVVSIKPSTSASPVIMHEGDYFKQLIEKAEQGDIREALESLNWVFQVDPQDGKAYCIRGVIRCKQERYIDAIADFNQALKYNFQDAIVYRNRGKARLQLGDNTGAIADFNKALELEPDNAMLFIARGNAYRSMGNHYGAVQDYTKALQLDPEDAHAYYNRGLAYTHIEEMQQAINDYQKAASIFCEKEDWKNYQKVLDSLNKITVPSQDLNKPQSTILRQKLLRLVGGYWEIAERLIEDAKYYYPGMSEDWYMEKVISDIERDRR